MPAKTTKISAQAQAILTPQSPSAKPTLTAEYLQAEHGLSATDAKAVASAYANATPGQKSGMRKRLEGTASTIAKQAATTRKSKAAKSK